MTSNTKIDLTSGTEINLESKECNLNGNNLTTLGNDPKYSVLAH